MSKRKIIVPLIIVLAAVVYFLFFHKDKTLKFIPENADAVVVIDIKKLTRQYIFSLATHPSRWSAGSDKNKNAVSLKDSGIRVPDFLQVFHLKDTHFSQWYSVLELKDREKFITFLKKNKFEYQGSNRFQNGEIFIVLDGKYCILGTSGFAFEDIRQHLLQGSNRMIHASQLMGATVGSLSFISGKKIQSFSIELKDNAIEIKSPFKKVPPQLSAGLEQRNHFLEMELDAENIKKGSRFFSKNLIDSSQITYFKATADLEQINDTIISYGYDDDFNEIEKKTIQKIVQPNYIFDLESRDPDRTWDYFQTKKWINARNEFTVIPFQPNTIIRKSQGLIIKSLGRPVSVTAGLKENYIFIKNSPLLLSSFKSLSEAEKKMLADIDFITYRNQAEYYGLKIQVKEGNLPLILRW
ncbi:hypothetical protein [Chryseobacterium pennipullorum]|uniref:Uncharacterized protein n=1 Tax=Chryseobacterium pennipullorum TaxID=2258963 RepID=A0A3D9AP48_9FLAO|nr:hypothetical protein [Chryseobacterium pennipullorum]REC43093.1 hypothetical protein DRF67_19695 [Chryseobacterium pennipullorum]